MVIALAIGPSMGAHCKFGSSLCSGMKNDSPVFELPDLVSMGQMFDYN